MSGTRDHTPATSAPTSDRRPAVTTTRAVVQHRYGPPSVLGLEDVPIPAPSSEQVLVRVEASAAQQARGEDGMAALRDDAARQLQKMLGLRAKVEVVASGTFPRTDFKARRVIDDRDVFRDMNARLAGGSA